MSEEPRGWRALDSPGPRQGRDRFGDGGAVRVGLRSALLLARRRCQTSPSAAPASIPARYSAPAPTTRLSSFQGISQTAGESASRGFCSAAERQCVEHRFGRPVLVLSTTLVERDRDSASTATALAGRRWSLLVPSGTWSTHSSARIVPERAPWRVRLTSLQRAFNWAVLSGRARGPIWLPGLLVGRSRSGRARRRGSSARRPARTCALLSPAR
jgi:hypothetical protein